MNSLISIIIPVYNRPKVVFNAIDSVANQSYTNWEIILVDDGSSSIDYQKKITDERITIINNKENKGVSFSRNVGIKKAKGDYIAFLDSDNTWDSHFLETMLKKIEQQDADAVFSSWKYIYQQDESLAISEESYNMLAKHFDVDITTDHLNGKEFIKFMLHNAINFIHINAVLIKAQNTELFDEKLSVSEDTIFMYKYLLNNEKIGIVKECLMSFISSQDSVYLYADRTTFKELDKIPKEILSKMIFTLNRTISSYEAFLNYLANYCQDDFIIGKIENIVFMKKYTVLIFKQLCNQKISYDELSVFGVKPKIRKFFKLAPFSKKKIKRSMIDYY